MVRDVFRNEVRYAVGGVVGDDLVRLANWEGLLVEDTVGLLDGVWEGLVDGARIGLPVGEMEGLVVERLLGLLDGAWEGLTDGAWVGLLVGEIE